MLNVKCTLSKFCPLGPESYNIISIQFQLFAMYPSLVLWFLVC